MLNGPTSPAVSPNHSPDNAFGSELRRMRLARGVSLDVFARLVKYSKGYLSKVENGHRPTAPDFIERCDVLLEAGGRLAALAPDTVVGRRPGVARLPSAPRLFVGRRHELGQLSRWPEGPAPVTVISGPAGIGKTTLALAWAHRMRRLFPDGGLFVDLRGGDGRGRVQTGAALGHLLRALGVPVTSIPPGEAERSLLLHELTLGRSLLVILDNAADVHQLRPLLPGADCTVVITSRDPLARLGPPGDVTRIALGPLHEADACALLRLRVGVRVSAERDATTAIARHCGQIPLALRIVAQRAASDPNRTLAELETELATACVTAPVGDEARTVVLWSYRAQPPTAAQALRRLALNPTPTISTGAAAALLGIEPDRVWQRVSALIDAHLLRTHRIGSFQFHDLVRACALERAIAEEPESYREAAIARLQHRT